MRPPSLISHFALCLLVVVTLAGGTETSAGEPPLAVPEVSDVTEATSVRATPKLSAKPGAEAAQEPVSLNALRNRSAADRWKALITEQEAARSPAADPPRLGSLYAPSTGEPQVHDKSGPSIGGMVDSHPRNHVETTAMRPISGKLDHNDYDPFASQRRHGLHRTAQLPQPPGLSPNSQRYAAPVSSPQDLKSITEIMPYFDYEPDDEVRMDDPCRNLCPRPDGAPCDVYAEGGSPPECPEEVPLGDDQFAERLFAESLFAWEASNLYHLPLYFEDAPLERYGHTYPSCLQPFASAGKFSAQLLGLPYQMAIDPICKKRYALGWYRPGECAPKLHYQVPWNTQAAAVQAGVYTGLFFLFP